MRTICIVQARTRSTRLPNKVMEIVSGKTLLEHHVERLSRAKTLDKVVVAVPVGEQDDALAEYCEGKRWATFRGPEQDVLGRYAMAAQKYRAKIVVRTTSDCPLIDCGVVDATVQWHKAGRFDMTSNAFERTFAHGLDVQVVSRKALDDANAQAKDSFDREHVLEWVMRHQDAPYKLGNLRFPIETADPLHAAVLVAARLTVDYPEDLELVRQIYAAFPAEHYISTADVVGLLAERPELMKLNETRAIEHAQRLDGSFEPVSEDEVAVDKLRREYAAKKARVILQ